MAYNFLDLTNATLRRFNDVTLTQSNFNSVKGFHAVAKDAVNSALHDIYSKHVEWPFNYQETTVTLTPGQNRYPAPADLKTYDIETFRIRANAALGVPSKYLSHVSYDEYLQNMSSEEDKGADEGALPQHVFLTRNMAWGVAPTPDKAYSLTFEYYSQPLELTTHSDVPNVPEAFRWVIVEGATYWCHVQRDNSESAQLTLKKFEQGINEMRRNLINKNDYMRPHTTFR